MNRPQKLCAFAQAQVDNGSIYVLGAQGETGSQITEAWIKMREHYKKADYDRAIKFWKKQISKGFVNLRAFDCSGLIIRHLQDEGLIKEDRNAHGIYNELCTAIKKADLRAGDLVAKYGLSGGKYKVYHIGVYMGDGTVVHAKGRDVGVVREKISKYSWNRYGRLKVFAKEMGVDDVIQKGDKGPQVASWQRALLAMGIDIGDYGVNNDGVDGEFGTKTETGTIQFKKKVGLNADNGIVDSVCMAAMLDSLYAKTGDSAKVKELQGKIDAALKALG